MGLRVHRFLGRRSVGGADARVAVVSADTEVHVFAVVTGDDIVIEEKPWSDLSRWARLCFWVSKALGGRKVFGKVDLASEECS